MTQITVSGSGFSPQSQAPQVRFNGSAITVTSFSDTQFVATLPNGLSAATYLLEVSTQDPFEKVEEFDVTIGVVGPQGPAGPTGPVGPQGIPGSAGFISNSVPGGNVFYGWARNLPVSTTPLNVAAFGSETSSGIIHPNYGGTTAGGPAPTVLTDPLNALGDLWVSLVNKTTNQQSVIRVFHPGEQDPTSADLPGTNLNSNGTIRCQGGDVVFIQFQLAAGSAVIPFIYWQ